SAGSRFELGFFKLGNSSNYYLGIWYHQLSIRTVVWIANRESHLQSRPLFSGSKFLIWSTDSSD
ncbi:G-type lectin S-receptor-like serine/threonine-protein kinase At4g27290, partial [Linum perenne]